MAGIRDWVSCFDSLEEAMIRNRVVQNAQSRRSWSDCASRFDTGSCARSSCGALASRN